MGPISNLNPFFHLIESEPATNAYFEKPQWECAVIGNIILGDIIPQTDAKDDLSISYQ